MTDDDHNVSSFFYYRAVDENEDESHTSSSSSSWTVLSDCKEKPYIFVFPDFINVVKPRLSLASSFFGAMFEHDFSEARGKVSLKNIDINSFVTILEHVLDEKELKIDDENVFEVYKTAIYLQFSSVVAKCDHFVAKQVLSVKKTLSIIHNLRGIQGVNNNNSLALRSAFILGLIHFDDLVETISEQNEIDDLGLIRILLELFGDPRCMVRDEVEVLAQVGQILSRQEEEEERNGLFRRFLSCLRRPEVSLPALREILQHSTDDSVFSSILEAEAEKNTNNMIRSSSMSDACLPTKPCVLTVIINPTTSERELHLMTLDTSSCSPSMFSLSNLTASIPDISWSLCEVSICHSGSDIYLLGGLRERPKRYGESVQWLEHIYGFDLISGKWSCSDWCELLRRKCSVSALGHHLFIRGGYGRHRVRQNNALCLDLKQQNLNKVNNSSLLTSLDSMSMAAWGHTRALMITNSHSDDKTFLELVSEDAEEYKVFLGAHNTSKMFLWCLENNLSSFENLSIMALLEAPEEHSGEFSLLTTPQSDVLISSILTFYVPGQRRLYGVDLNSSTQKEIKKLSVITQFNHDMWNVCRCGNKVYNFVTLYKEEEEEGDEQDVPRPWQRRAPEERLPEQSLVECFDLDSCTLSVVWQESFKDESVTNKSKIVFCDQNDPSHACLSITNFEK